MSRKDTAFTPSQRAYLNSLPAIKHATATRIYYTSQFHKDAVQQYDNGVRPSVIFAQAGMPSTLIGSKRIERCINRRENTDYTQSGMPEQVHKQVSIFLDQMASRVEGFD
ncbi:hypothetical protein BFS15_00850 [Gardnerella sp. DNF01162]|jgi:hypothetical protein|uniref:Uncharacterized protein n=1 Tax=Gardnerella swidsinskii TaxID=2792979 RepID=A0A9X7FFI2_9BIFI|nr:hypothetical protein BVL65_00855 [Gardnerella vaginalis]PMC55285.1 hypothetical protein CJ213_04110 [Gardnerella swidsinskii]PNP91382.1 hypothetical protein BFS15_00850 [Gardnerella sp. DNF01162]RIY26965.1 hypothetical protein CJI51_00920 [Bifidobacteriaceae bacterium WP021]PMC51146.1 hypothetical protein CJ211_03715 [Gardnerella vaginalis]